MVSKGALLCRQPKVSRLQAKLGKFMWNLHLLEKNISQAQILHQKGKLFIPLFINPAKFQGLLVITDEVQVTAKASLIESAAQLTISAAVIKQLTAKSTHHFGRPLDFGPHLRNS